MTPDARQLINCFQGGVPLVSRPFEAMGKELGMSEAEVITLIQSLLDQGILTRFGPLYNIERMGGHFSLVALSVPDALVESTAAMINAYPEVAHHYHREHVLNLWFVLATESLEHKSRVLAAMTQETGYPLLDMPKLREYFVQLTLEA
jgi:siroheme decarboxylase